MTWSIQVGDCLDLLRQMPAESVHCCVTSPPYWGLRDYGVDGQLGLERTPEAYIAKMVEVFREVRRVLRKDGVCWVNMGDCYAHGISRRWLRFPKRSCAMPPKAFSRISLEELMATQQLTPKSKTTGRKKPAKRGPLAGVRLADVQALVMHLRAEAFSPNQMPDWEKLHELLEPFETLWPWLEAHQQG